jgi:hypothetical protein
MRHLIGLLLLAALPTAQQDSTPSARIVGFVIDSRTDMPLTGVRIELAPVGLTAVTDDVGGFAFDSIAVGNYLLTGEKVGYFPIRPDDGKITDKPGVSVIVTAMATFTQHFKMTPTATFSGKVIDDRGNPVQGAKIIPFRYVYDGMGKRVPTYYATVQSNDLGEFRAENLDKGEYWLRIDAPAVDRSAPNSPLFPSIYFPGVSSPQDALPVRLENGLELQLPNFLLHAVQGRAVTLHAVNRTIAGDSASMYLARRGELPGRPSQVTFVNSATQVTNLAPGTYNAEVYVTTREGPLRGATSFEISDRDLDLDITMHMRTSIRGHALAVTEGVSTPVSGLEVRFINREFLQNVQPTLRSSADGVLMNSESAALFPGIYDIEVRNIASNLYLSAATEKQGGRDLLRDGLAVEDGRPLTLEIVLSKGTGTIGGSVTDGSGVVLADAVVVLVPRDPMQSHLYKITQTDVHGGFQLRAAKGEYDLYSFRKIAPLDTKNSKVWAVYKVGAMPVTILDDKILRVDLTVLD